ncbi:hypothetical protein L873DRAFT_1839544 [Choiromyces venosus 120613-1]|uniref:Uncharacterized protein n=1 Tax=Choiromyces venosus 120613-1 TaxID=1336337 RepID=A0A3N4K9E6_9PEZI|nr:hypothetical protein L873DRAFT_1839544 [Choiromyces venosus 120613-1]
MKGPITRSRAPRERKGHKYTDLSKQGVIIALHQLQTGKALTMQEIEKETGVPRSTASGMCRNDKTAACKDKENSDPDPTAMANLMPEPRSGIPCKFDDVQRAEVVYSFFYYYFTTKNA